jgi:hypothetical protein
MHREIIELSIEIAMKLICEINNEINKMEKDDDLLLLIDMCFSLKTSINLIEKGQYVNSMIVLRGAYELLMMYIVIKNDIKMRERYLKMDDFIRIKTLKEEASKYMHQDKFYIDKYYEAMSNFVHPTVIRNYLFNVQTDKNNSFLILGYLNFISIVNTIYDELSLINNYQNNEMIKLLMLYFIYITLYISKHSEIIELLKKYEKYLSYDNNK